MTKNIVLLTPYTGKNLGDASIQKAVIDNIHMRHKSANIRGITLLPENTAKIHVIDCFPLISENFSNFNKPNNNSGSTYSNKKKINKSFITLNNKYIRFILKAIIYLPNAGYKRFVLLRDEVNHIYRGYKFMKNTDQAIFSGGGQLDDHWGGPWHHPYSILKWAILARVAGAKLIFLSIGADHLKSTLTRFFIKRALLLAHYRSFRDEETKSLSIAMGISNHDQVYPDLAYSLPVEKYNTMPDHTHRPVVGISPIGAPAWSTPDSKLFETYMENLTSLVSWLLSEKYTVLFFSSQINDDPPLIEDILKRLKAIGLRYEKEQIISNSVIDIDDLLHQIAKTDIVVASRFHSILLAHILGKPTLALSYRSKVENLMENADLEQYCLDINNHSVEDMKTLILTLFENQGIISKHLLNQEKAHRQSLSEQYDKVLGY